MLAIVFPGQGSQTLGMACDFAAQFPESRAVLEEADEAFGGPLREWIEHGPEERLRRTEVTQPAILAASIAVYRAIAPRLEVPAAFLAGHSLGEYTAQVAGGGLELAEAVRLVRRRGALMQEAVPEGEGAMAAVLGLSADDVDGICAATEGVVAPANLNAPAQTVIAGARAAVEAAASALREAGAKRVVPLDVSAPFHCELMASAQEKLTPELAAAGFRDLAVPVLSNVTAEPYRTAAEARELLRRQVCAPVRWVACVERLVREGVRVQLELGPGKILTGLASRIDRGLACARVSTVAEADAALRRVEEALA